MIKYLRWFGNIKSRKLLQDRMVVPLPTLNIFVLLPQLLEHSYRSWRPGSVKSFLHQRISLYLLPLSRLLLEIVGYDMRIVSSIIKFPVLEIRNSLWLQIEFRRHTWWVNIIIYREESRSRCFPGNAYFCTKWCKEKSHYKWLLSSRGRIGFSALCQSSNHMHLSTRRVLLTLVKVLLTADYSLDWTTGIIIMAKTLSHWRLIRCSSHNPFCIPQVIVTTGKCHM